MQDNIFGDIKLEFSIFSAQKYIEALLFASTEPLSQSLVNSIFPNEKVNLKESNLDLNKDYQESNKLNNKMYCRGYQIC